MRKKVTMGKKVNLSEQDLTNLVTDYVDNRMGVAETAVKYRIGKLRLKALLTERGIHIRSGSEQNTEPRTIVVADAKTKKYLPTDKGHYVAVSKKDGTVFDDIENRGGFLTTYIRKELGVEVPPLFARNKYYQETGNYWWEQFFDAKFVEEKPVKKCPYCDWMTEDIDNKSGAFEKHLREKHGLSKLQYINEHPEDKPYFALVNPSLNLQMETDENKFVTCPICGKKMHRITTPHMKSHGFSRAEFIDRYGNSIFSAESLEKFRTMAKNMNMRNEENPDKFTSKPENEIKEYISGLGISCRKDRHILNGQELDIYISSKRMAIEFNGLKWHSEWFGHKGPNTHLEKTEKCCAAGIKLIQIFEDEYYLKRDIVLAKTKHLLGVDDGIKVGGRKCEIREICPSQALSFLDEYHLQGGVNATVHYGAFYEGRLIGVMSFLREDDLNWNLIRFATDYHYMCSGVAGKLFSHFIKSENPNKVKTFADRRWTPMSEGNLYTALGFSLDGITKPDYCYYNPHVDRYQRFHKFGFRKEILLRKHPEFSDAMTETEMARALGYDRIWNCGLFRYVWTKEEKR